MARNKSVLVTGGSDRLGKNIGMYFASIGYNVAVHYSRSLEKARLTRQDILSEYDVECEIFKADFSNEKETQKLISDVSSVFQISCLVNNASIFYENSFADKGTAGLTAFFDVNFRAPYILTKQFAEIAPEGALILNILDTKISRATTRHFDYLLSKKFLAVFTRQVAMELAPKIRVNGIAPGIILPPEGKDDEYIERMAESIPLKKRGYPDNIINSVDFFIRDNFVTGQIIFNDGGENL